MVLASCVSVLTPQAGIFLMIPWLYKWGPPRKSPPQAVKDWDSDAAAQACGAGLPGSQRGRGAQPIGHGAVQSNAAGSCRQARSQKLAQEDGGRQPSLPLL